MSSKCSFGEIYSRINSQKFNFTVTRGHTYFLCINAGLPGNCLNMRVLD